jgi:hypothetical protein
MLLRKFVILGLCGLVLGVSAGRSLPSVGACTDAHGSNPAVEIALRLDKPEVTPLETVCLEESIPASMDARVTLIGHDIVRIGCYDRQLGKLVNLRRSLFSAVKPNVSFDELPELLASSHPMLFDIRTPTHKGIQFTFRPNRLGIFLITTTWYLRNREARISSSPVVLVVKPPVDARGRAVVKPEWLADDGWGKVEVLIDGQDKR